jgi:hypothetical protein
MSAVFGLQLSDALRLAAGGLDAATRVRRNRTLSIS